MSSAASSQTDPWRLDGRAVMISGGAGGIGRAVVQVLERAGARVSVCDLALPSQDGDRVDLEGNLADPEAARAWVDLTLERLGAIDALVNVAGLWRQAPFTEIAAAEMRALFDANFTTTWNASQAAAPHMLARGSGCIVNVASTAGQFGSIRPGAHYAAAKGAVIALTKTLARELAPGVRVNAISPGPIDTSAAGSGVNLDTDEVRARTLLGRAGLPEEVANGVLYLVSDASSYATGSVLAVNGGSLI